MDLSVKPIGQVPSLLLEGKSGYLRKRLLPAYLRLDKGFLLLILLLTVCVLLDLGRALVVHGLLFVVVIGG